MSIYIVTENNFFFLGMEELLSFKKDTIQKISPEQFDIIPMSVFFDDDIFIFHTANFSVELSFLISTRGLPGELFFIPTTRKERFKLAFNRYVYLDTYASMDDVLNKIIHKNDCDSVKYNVFKEPLTEREKLVMRHTINGMNAQKISQCLCISTKTVYTHRRNAFHKLGGRNLFEIWPFRGKILRTEIV